jgi:hypothetical protein
MAEIADGIDTRGPKMVPGLVLDMQGIPVDRHETTRAAVVAGIQGFPGTYEAWTLSARRPPGYFVRIIGPRGFFRQAQFTGEETAGEISERIRQTMRS